MLKVFTLMSEQLFRVVTNLRKEGKLDEAWNIGQSAVQENPNDTYLKGAFFWVCYAYLKEIQKPINDRGKDNNGNYRPKPVEFDRISCLLDWIVWLNIPPGGYEYPNLLLLFQKNLDCFPQIVHFLLKYQDLLFTDKEKEPFQGEKGESPSLMLKCARQVAKAWIESSKQWGLEVDEVLSLLNKTRKQTSDVQHKIWLDYDEAKCLIKAGRNDEAREFVIPVLKKKQSESWAWGALAFTYRSQDAGVAIKLFAQGLCNTRDEKYALRLLKGIAPFLADKGFTDEASMCVLRAVNCYQENGWKIKADLEALLGKPWFDNTVNISDLDSFLHQQSIGAMAYLHGDTKSATGLVINLHKSGKGLHLYLSEKESISVPLHFFKKSEKPELGNYAKVSISCEGEDKSVVAAELTSSQSLIGVETIEEELRVTEKGFGFAGDTFIPPFLIEDGMNNKLVEVLRYKDFDKKKGRLGWRALSLKVCS